MPRRLVNAAPPPAPAPTSAPTGWAQQLRRVTSFLFSLVSLLLALTTIGLTLAFMWSLPAPPDNVRSEGTNALRADRSWITIAHTNEQYDQFALQLRKAAMSEVLVTVSPPDASNQHTTAFITALHQRAPGVRVYADLGPLLAWDGGAASTLERAVANARSFLGLGFDGVHVAIRPLAPSSPGASVSATLPSELVVLDLLAQLRELTDEQDRTLSAEVGPPRALPIGEPLTRRWFPAYAGPEPSFLDEVADLVHQLVIRTDASAAPTASAFAAWVAWHTERTARIVSDRVALIIAIPSGDVDTWDRHPWAEAPGPALHGLRRGVDALGDDRESLFPIGAGLLDERAMSEQDWRLYDEEWVDARP